MSDPKDNAAIEDDIEVIIDDEAEAEAKADGGETDDPDEREAVDADEDGEDADAEGDSEEARAEKQRRRGKSRAVRRREREAKQEQEMALLRAELAELKGLSGKVSELDEFRTAQRASELAQAKAYHDDQIRRAQNTYQDAVQRRAKALQEGDGEAFNAADADIRLAERVYAESNAAIESIKKAPDPVRREEAPRVSEIDIRRKMKAEAFLSENSWYDPKLGDEDSVILKAIDDQLAREGSDPSTDQHWEELKRRAAKRIPERFSPDRRPKDASRTPPEMVAGSSRDRSNPTQRVSLSPERYQALLDSGKVSGLDDPALKVWAKKYATYDRNNSAA